MPIIDTKFSNIETGKERLREAVQLRKEVKGFLPSIVVGYNCNEIAAKLGNMGCDYAEIRAIMHA